MGLVRTDLKIGRGSIPCGIRSRSGISVYAITVATIAASLCRGIAPRGRSASVAGSSGAGAVSVAGSAAFGITVRCVDELVNVAG